MKIKVLHYWSLVSGIHQWLKISVIKANDADSVPILYCLHYTLSSGHTPQWYSHYYVKMASRRRFDLITMLLRHVPRGRGYPPLTFSDEYKTCDSYNHQSQDGHTRTKPLHFPSPGHVETVNCRHKTWKINPINTRQRNRNFKRYQ